MTFELNDKIVVNVAIDTSSASTSARRPAALSVDLHDFVIDVSNAIRSNPPQRAALPSDADFTAEIDALIAGHPMNGVTWTSELAPNGRSQENPSGGWDVDPPFGFFSLRNTAGTRYQENGRVVFLQFEWVQI